MLVEVTVVISVDLRISSSPSKHGFLISAQSLKFLYYLFCHQTPTLSVLIFLTVNVDVTSQNGKQRKEICELCFHVYPLRVDIYLVPVYIYLIPVCFAFLYCHLFYILMPPPLINHLFRPQSDDVSITLI